MGVCLHETEALHVEGARETGRHSPLPYNQFKHQRALSTLFWREDVVFVRIKTPNRMSWNSGNFIVEKACIIQEKTWRSKILVVTRCWGEPKLGSILNSVSGPKHNDEGFCSFMVLRSFWFSLLRTCAIDCTDSNQTLGSSFLGLYSPRAIAIVLFL